MPSPGPVLSVVLTARNQLQSIKFTLLSLQDQAPDIPHEIIVTDCGSTDGTDRFLAELAAEGKIRAILEREGKGRTQARNQAAHAAAGRYLMFMDPGMVVGPGWWESLVRTLDMDPRVGAAAGKVLLPDGKIEHAGLAMLEWWGESENEQTRAYGNNLTARGILAGRPGGDPSSCKNLRVQALCGEALLVRAEPFFAVGGFSARLGREHGWQHELFAGDLSGADLCLRLGSRGWDCVYRHESIMTRLAEPGSGAAEPADERQQQIFNSSWLGRARGDFRIIPGQGTQPSASKVIHPYVEPVIAFAARDGKAAAPVWGPGLRGMSTVVIAVGDDLEEAGRSLPALLQHTDSLHEIVLVDAGASAEVRDLVQTLCADDSRCRLLGEEAASSRAMAFNRGLVAARGKHIVLLDNSTVVTPGWLETLVAAADFHTRAGLVGPVSNRLMGLQHLAEVDYDQQGLAGLNSFAAQVRDRRGGRVDLTNRLAGFCLLIKREVLARIGGLDERFDWGNYEVNDYCLRSSLAGYECLVAAGCFVHLEREYGLTDEQMNHLKRLTSQWEMFKVKWGIPQDTALGAPMDLGGLLSGGFNPLRHFQPLPEPAAVKDSEKREALA
jgi:GT2 family glycosyltransferase